MKRSFAASVVVCLVLLSAVSLMAQQDLIANFEKRVTVQQLDNGLTVLICQRPEAPVFSFYTFVDAGSVQDPKNETGMAHMFEHMAFKGTDKIGTTDYAAERAALEKVEQAYAAYRNEREKSVGRDEKKVQQLFQAFQQAADEAEKYVIKNQFGEIVEINGGVGLNASTSYDETVYEYSMPVNRVELWAYLESERFVHPVMREFYKERDVVMEERRMRTDSRPTGRLIEQFVAASFLAHPYHRPTIGWPSDLTRFSATEAMNFFRRYYVPSNMVVAVAGDVKPEQLMPVVQKYFGRLPASPRPIEDPTVEPPQNSERQVVLRETAQPFYIEGYHRPSFRDPDDAVYDVISDLLSSGRTSRLYRSLVRDKRIAAMSAGFSGFPGTKYPHLFAFYAVPMPGHTPQEIRDAIHAEIAKLKTEDVTDDELKMVKTRARANLIRGLADNAGLAQQFGTAQMRYGDWREIFRQVDRIEAVTKADIRRVANKTFLDTNRTVGVIENTMARAAAPASAPAKTASPAKPPAKSPAAGGKRK
jgi:predicted Zn-dependent peptidase